MDKRYVDRLNVAAIEARWEAEEAATIATFTDAQTACHRLVNYIGVCVSPDDIIGLTNRFGSVTLGWLGGSVAIPASLFAGLDVTAVSLSDEDGWDHAVTIMRWKS